MVAKYEEALHESFAGMVREADAFFMRSGRLMDTLRRLAERCTDAGIAYAIVGGMALGEHGYVRMTEDVDVLLTAEGLQRFRDQLVGRGYVATHPGAQRTFRDTESGVRLEFLVTGEYPGDGKPKAIRFPEPLGAGTEIDGVRVLTLPRLIELKLASGMSAPHRLRDLADVQEVIKAKQLDAAFATQLDPSVRGTYLELEQAVRQSAS